MPYNLLNETILFITKKFAGMNRKGSVSGEKIPTVIHSIEVMKNAWNFGVTDESVLAAYLAHDILEDTNTTVEELKELIGAYATGIVLEMTFDPKKWSKQEYIDSFWGKSTESVVGKVIDRLVNIKDFSIVNPDYASEYFKKAASVFKTFFDRMNNKDETFTYVTFQEISKKIEDLELIFAFEML